MALGEALAAHLATGATTLCRCWRVRRHDGTVLGFTDHDVAVTFDGQRFAPEDGLSARAFEQTTGLAVDNSEAVGVLSGDGVREADIVAGLYDGAEVTASLVNWADPGQRVVQFRGTLGEIVRSGGAFRAELRGLAEALNQPQGRVYQAPCPAILGDADCRVDLGAPGYFAAADVETAARDKVFRFALLGDFEDRWFERGTLRVLSGASAGQVAVVKNDRADATGRTVEIWEALRGGIAAGDFVRLEAGCDKRFATCGAKFGNAVNFRGFPHLPGEDWLMAYPRSGDVNDGGSLS